MKKINIINILLVILTAILSLAGYYLNNPEFSRILYMAGIVIGFWGIMRIFKIKRFATED